MKEQPKYSKGALLKTKVALEDTPHKCSYDYVRKVALGLTPARTERGKAIRELLKQYEHTA